MDVWGSCGDKDADGSLLGCNAASTCSRVSTFKKNILLPSSALKMKAECSSETLVPTHKSTQRHSPEHHWHFNLEIKIRHQADWTVIFYRKYKHHVEVSITCIGMCLEIPYKPCKVRAVDVRLPLFSCDLFVHLLNDTSIHRLFIHLLLF
jgi:hypothetical protein